MSSASPLATFPDHVREAHARWLATRDPEALAIVVIAIVAYHRPDRQRLEKPDDLSPDARLIEDLGFDSLALAEIIFFVEDLYQVSISNDDLRSIATVADLRAFVLGKVVAIRPAAA
jgi:acyl carrier protein